MTILTTFKNYLFLMRPRQWVKNLLLLFPPFFGGKILDPTVLTTLVPSFLAFSFAASTGYILNDIADRAADQHHAEKKNRPIARGEIPVAVAYVIAAVLYVASMFFALAMSRHFEGYVILYILITALYTYYFKNIVIIDLFFISFGFIIRVLAGGEAFHTTVSGWLFLTVFIVSIFLSSGKRLGELIILQEEAGNHRQSLSHYSVSFLEGVLWFSASATLVTYALYTLEHHNGLFYTVPLTAFGLMRYIYIVKQGKGDPTEALLMDSQIVSVGILWAVMIGVIIYR